MKIQSVIGRQILDSRGNPTVEVDVVLENGVKGRAAVPSGASTGSREALEKRDGDAAVYLGKGVLQAVDAINTTLAPALIGFDVHNQLALDEKLLELDGTENKENCGANALLGVSLAVMHAAAADKGISVWQNVAQTLGQTSVQLPVPMLNVINGGEHANNSLDIQEFMVIPAGFGTLSEALRAGVEIFHILKGLLAKAGFSTAVGDEGGFAPSFEGGNAEAFDWLMKAVEKAGYVAGEQIFFAVDAAASEFYKDGAYVFNGEGGRKLSAQELVDYYADLCDRYPILSIEDGMDEGDREGWKLLTERLGDQIQLVGDDLFVTNPAIFEQGIEDGLANSILVKVNQIGTLSETFAAMALARKANYTAVMSHRSGETEDATIADLAVGTACGQIKTGAPSRSDRVAKYNQLLRIEAELGDSATYAGLSVFER